jgi:ribosomal protein S27E
MPVDAHIYDRDAVAVDAGDCAKAIVRPVGGGAESWDDVREHVGRILIDIIAGTMS